MAMAYKHTHKHQYTERGSQRVSQPLTGANTALTEVRIWQRTTIDTTKRTGRR